MSLSLQQLREERARKATEYTKLVKSEKFTKEIEAQAEAIAEEIERIDAQIRAINNAVALAGDGADEYNARIESDARGRSVDENTHRV